MKTDTFSISCLGVFVTAYCGHRWCRGLECDDFLAASGQRPQLSLPEQDQLHGSLMTGPQRVAGLFTFLEHGDCNTGGAHSVMLPSATKNGISFEVSSEHRFPALRPQRDQAHDATAGAEEGECCRQAGACCGWKNT